MSEPLPGMEEAERKFRESRWEVDVNVSSGTAHVGVHRGSMSIKNSAIYVKEPNWLELKLGITFERKLIKAINKQKKRCDTLNTEIVKEDELKIKAKKILDLME